MGEAVLVAGTCCYFDVESASSGFLELEGVRSLGEIGSKGSFVDQSTIKDTTKRSKGGMKDTQESTLRIAYYADDKNQSKFMLAAKSSENMKLKIVYPPSKTGMQLVVMIDIATSGYSLPEASDGNAIQEFNVSYKISGEPAIVETEQGKALSITALTVTTQGSVTLSDGDYNLYQGKDFTTSGDGDGAQIKVIVASNKITAARVTHGGIGYDIGDTITVTRVGGVSSTTNAVLTVSAAS